MGNLSDPIEFGEWLPDMGAFDNPGSLIAQNVVTEKNIYKPFASLAEAMDALPAKCKGAFAYRDAEGNISVFAGTLTKLYKLDGLGWDEVTRASGGDYTTSEDGFWDFLNFGTLVIATNYNDDIQVFDIASSTEFEQLSATAPRCRRFFTIKGFLVCVDTVDGDGAIGYRVRWSPFEDPRGDWTPNPTETQADFQDIFGGDYSNSFGAELQDIGVIVQGNELWRMEFVGGEAIFSFTKIENGRGSILPRACISNGRSVFFPAQDGFYRFDGMSLTPIGNGRIDKTFYKDFDEVFDYNMNVTIDPIKKLILWAYPSHDANDGMPDKILAYNWGDDKFTLILQETEQLFTFLSPGFTIDSMDGLYPSLEDIPFSLDSRFWTGGKTVLGAFSANHRLGAFTGTPNTATIGTPEVTINSGNRTIVESICAYIDGGTHRARLGSRNRLNDDVVYTPWVNQNSMTGEVDFHKDAKFHRAEIEISGAWLTAHSLAVRSTKSGRA